MQGSSMDSVSLMEVPNDPESAVIEVWPGPNKQVPALPFLHKGDIYETCDGVEWEVTKAIQSEHGEFNSGDNRYYSWLYKARLVEK